MALVIVYNQASGVAAVVYPAPADRQEGESEQQQAERLLASRDIPAGVQAHIADSSQLPSATKNPGETQEQWEKRHRKFRNQWKVQSDGQCVIDPVGAVNQIVSETRRERNKLLDASDRDKIRLDEVGTRAEREALATYRQRLRDLPAAVAAQIAGLSRVQLEAYTPTYPTP